MSFIGVAIGDLHLDKLTKYWANANTMQLDAAKRAVLAAIQKGATHAFFLGDISEGVRDSTGNAMRLSEPAQCAFVQFLFWLDSVIDSSVILGNHDWGSEGVHSLSMFLELQRQQVFKRVRIYPSLEKVRIQGVRVAMMHVLMWT